MAGLEELKRRLQPLFFDPGGNGAPSTGSGVGYEVVDGGAVNLLSRTSGEYDISELGFHKRTTGPYGAHSCDKAYRCWSHEMHIFGSVGTGSSSVVQRAIYIPTHRIMALKKINVFDEDKREQILNELRTLLEASCYPGLVHWLNSMEHFTHLILEQYTLHLSIVVH